MTRPLAHCERVPLRVACHRLRIPAPPQLGPVALEVALQEGELLVAERLRTLGIGRRAMLGQPQQQGLAIDGDERRQPHGLQRAVGVRHHVAPQRVREECQPPCRLRSAALRALQVDRVTRKAATVLDPHSPLGLVNEQPLRLATAAVAQHLVKVGIRVRVRVG